MSHIFSVLSFSHSSLQNLSSSIRLDGEHRCTAIFRSLQRCSIGFKSGLWLGHSRTFTELAHSHSFVIFAVCLGSLSDWKMNRRTSLSEAQSALEQVFNKDVSEHCCIHLSLGPD